MATILGEPLTEFIDTEYSGELTQRYSEFDIFYNGDQVDYIKFYINKNDFISKMMNKFDGPKYTSDNGQYAIHSQKGNELFLFKTENEVSFALFIESDPNFIDAINAGEYVRFE